MPSSSPPVMPSGTATAIEESQQQLAKDTEAQRAEAKKKK